MTDPTTGERRDISGLRPVDWEAHYAQDFPSLKLTLGADLFGGWRQTFYRFNQVQTTKRRTFAYPFAEWRPKPDLSLRIEIDNIAERGREELLTQFPGPRNRSGPAFVQARRLKFGWYPYIRLRRTFG